MMRHTGGFAPGATSTRSRSSWRAMARASGSSLMPSCSPSGSTRRTSRARMRSLMRGSVVTVAAMRLHSLCSDRGTPPTDRRGAGRSGGPHGHGTVPVVDPASRASSGGRVGAASRAPLPLHALDRRLPAVGTLWTPGGERPVGRPAAEPPGWPPPRTQPAARAGSGGPSDEEVAARLETMQRELVDAPAEVVVANHCYGLFELAAVYLSQQPPHLPKARLAIDALGAVVEGLAGRLGEAESSLRDGLSQLRLAYVQIDGAQRAGAEAASAVGTNGGGRPGSAGQ